MRLTVTVVYLDGHVDEHEADHLRTEAAQWRLDQGEDIMLIPMCSVRSVLMQEKGKRS